MVLSGKRDWATDEKRLRLGLGEVRSGLAVGTENEMCGGGRKVHRPGPTLGERIR